jgi:hypothetical protein
MPTSSGPNTTLDNNIIFSYDIGDTSNSYRGEPTENILAIAGSDAEIERSGTGYPYYWFNIDSAIQSRWSPSNNQLTISFEGKRDYSVGGTGGGGDGYPVFYVYFTDWSWAAAFGITSYDWSYGQYTFTMPNPSGKTVAFSIYHMNAGNPGMSYSRKHQIEFKNHATQFVNGTRSATQGLVPLIGNTSLDISNVSFTSNAQMTFDGTDDYLNAPINLGVLNQYTVEHISYKGSENRMPISVISPPIFYQYGDNSWYYTHGGVSGEYYYPKSFTINGWGHWVITYNGSFVRIYRNGVYEGQQATTGTANFSSGLKIGNYIYGGYPWNGQIALVKFYNTALSADQVKQNYNQYKTRFNLS